ncbi:hypothetical protein XELAEV_18000537mg [Xenopus laevis]|nr:hypothetical protein XELAEV_18000537mg [Xenopus laevis]
MMGTGGGPPSQLDLRDYEADIAKYIGPDTISGMEGSFDTDATGADNALDLQQSQSNVEDDESEQFADVSFCLEDLETQPAEPHETVEPTEGEVDEPQEEDELIPNEEDLFNQSIQQLTARLSSSSVENQKRQKQLKRTLNMIHEDLMCLNNNLQQMLH